MWPTTHVAKPLPSINGNLSTSIQRRKFRYYFSLKTHPGLPDLLDGQDENSKLRTQNLKLRPGYISNYQGIRIASSGQRFAIANVTLWAVIDAANHTSGQAATFNQAPNCLD